MKIEDIEGIRPTYANKLVVAGIKTTEVLLEEAGVNTVVELSKRNPNSLCAKLMEINETKKLVRRPPTLENVKSWVKQANFLMYMNIRLDGNRFGRF